jgi:hypothetical protein
MKFGVSTSSEGALLALSASFEPFTAKIGRKLTGAFGLRVSKKRKAGRHGTSILPFREDKVPEGIGVNFQVARLRGLEQLYFIWF